MHIAIYGAFDRFNFGDLLFPLVLESAFRVGLPDCSLEYYGVVESDLSRYGGKPTKPVHELFSGDGLADGSVVILAGGEVLAARWMDIYAYLIPHEFRPFIDALYLQVPLELRRSLLPVMSGPVPELPFSVAPSDFGARVRVAYNAVGGMGLASPDFPPHLLETIKEKLQSAAFASVRDEMSLRILNSSTTSDLVRLAPDSASLISAYFPKESLPDLMSSRVLSDVVDRYDSGYLVFQVKRKYADSPDAIRQAAIAIEEVYRQYRLPTVLCPFGTALYHEDQVPLRQIQQAVTTPTFLMEDSSVYDIMGVIANARAFAGTALHGAISAMAYAVPNLALAVPGVRKVEVYLDTWAIPALKGSVPLTNLADALGLALDVPRSQLEDKRSHLIGACMDSFRHMLVALEENEGPLTDRGPEANPAMDASPRTGAVLSAAGGPVLNITRDSTAASRWLTCAVGAYSRRHPDPRALADGYLRVLSDSEDRIARISPKEFRAVMSETSAVLSTAHFDGRSRRAFARQLLVAAYFQAAHQGRHALVRWIFPRLLLAQPTCARNLGVWSIAITALLGEDKADRIKNRLRPSGSARRGNPHA